MPIPNSERPFQGTAETKSQPLDYPTTGQSLDNPTTGQPHDYPTTARESVVDSYGEHQVRDPYRWLEDDRSDATADWVTRQNALTFAYLQKIPFRAALQTRISKLLNYPRISAPEQKGGWLLFSKNEGLQNQAVIYIQDGEHGTPEVLLDPNTMSIDGTTRIGALVFNGNGSRIAYTISKAGSDWQTINVLDTKSRAQLSDAVEWVKVSNIAWFGDGFFYSRYPEPSQNDSEFSSSNDDHQVYFHQLGTPQSSDRLAYRDEVHAQRFHTLTTTEDERFAVLYISDRGQGKDGSAFSVMDLQKPNDGFRALWTTFDDQMSVINNVGDKLLVATNRNAPNGRVVLIDPLNADETNWVTVLAEQSNVLDAVATAGGKLFATYLRDVLSSVSVHSLAGAHEREIELPGIGTAVGFAGEHDAKEVFYTFTSFTSPPTVYRYDIASGHSHVFRELELPFDASQFESQQIFVTSNDGTRVPAFIVNKKGLVRDGNNPTLVYGYGGFNVSLPPSFSSARIAFLEQGGVFVSMNLRGGGEYGDAWHKAGMKQNKQNVFDDCVAVLNWLIDNRYTNSSKLALQGGSNGGLLVGAIMTQRPELIKVALPSVGVLDMLRFHKFTIGWNWIADYGSSDNPAEFDFLYAYSPLHNLKDGVTYPATLITTGDHDDRVVPAHSFKFAARLQAAHRGANPVLIRIETQSGHGSSSLTKAIAETADVFSFMLYNMGITPRFE
ncbi:MAG: prolyl oligopeptidase family serine peptidase [Gemmatimonadaceae bacterium]